MSADPLDKQLVEAVLSRPRRAKADLEEAKMAGLRPSRPKAGVAVAGDDDDDDDDDDLDLGPEVAEDGADVGIVVVTEDGAVDPAAKLPSDAPAKLDPKEVEEPSAEELEAISADMIGIDDPVRMYLKEIGKVAELHVLVRLAYCSRHRSRQPPRVHGDGRAVHERRRGARGRPPASRHRHHARRTTISTVGWLPGLERFVEEVSEPIRLALSLQPPTRRSAAS